MLRVSVKNVTGRFWTLVLTALSVVLGTAFVAGSLVFTDSIDRTFSQLFSDSSRNDAVVRGLEGSGGTQFGDGRLTLPLALADDIQAVPGVEAARPDLFGLALLVGADGTAVRNSGAPSFGQALDPDDPGFSIVEGRAPEGPGEVAVESFTLETSGLSVGDRTQVLAGTEPVDVTVVGDIQQDAATLGSTLVLFDRATAESYFAPDGTVSSFSIRGDGDASQEELVEAISAVLPDTAEAVTQDTVVAENEAALGTALGFVNTFLLVVGAVSLLVGAFIIANVFSMLLARRTRELALLRAVGASASQVLGAVLVEAVVVGLIGSVLGLGVGVLIALGLQAAVGSFGFEISGGLPVDATTVVVTLLVGLIVTVVSAVVPAVRASRIAPVAAMRDEVALPERAIRLRAVIGLVLAAAGTAALLLGLFGDVPEPLYWVGAGALAMVFGITVAAPAIARPVVWLVSVPTVALFGAVARLARQNSLRNPRRTAATASSLMIGTALVGAATIVASSVNASLAETIENDLRADYVLSAGQVGVFPTTVADQVAELDQVSAVVPARTVDLQVLPQGSGGDLPPPGQPILDAVEIVALASELGDLTAAVDLTILSEATPDAGSDVEVIAVSEDTADAYDWALGDVLTARAGVADLQEFTVGTIYEDATFPGTPAIVPAAVYQAATPEGQRVDNQVFVVAAEGGDLGALRTQLVEIVQPYLVVSVLDGEEFTDEATSAVTQILGVISALLGLSILVALIGIVITLVLSVIERRREIGLLRAVGLTQVQLRRAVTLEGVATSVFGALLGIALGIVFGLALQRALSEQGLDTLSVPWLTLAVFVVAGALVGIVAAAAPAWWASKRNVLESIATA